MRNELDFRLKQVVCNPNLSGKKPSWCEMDVRVRTLLDCEVATAGALASFLPSNADFTIQQQLDSRS